MDSQSGHQESSSTWLANGRAPLPWIPLISFFVTCISFGWVYHVSEEGPMKVPFWLLSATVFTVGCMLYYLVELTKACDSDCHGSYAANLEPVSTGLQPRAEFQSWQGRVLKPIKNFFQHFSADTEADAEQQSWTTKALKKVKDWFNPTANKVHASLPSHSGSRVPDGELGSKIGSKTGSMYGTKPASLTGPTVEAGCVHSLSLKKSQLETVGSYHESEPVDKAGLALSRGSQQGTFSGSKPTSNKSDSLDDSGSKPKFHSHNSPVEASTIPEKAIDTIAAFPEKAVDKITGWFQQPTKGSQDEKSGVIKSLQEIDDVVTTSGAKARTPRDIRSAELSKFYCDPTDNRLWRIVEMRTTQTYVDVDQFVSSNGAEGLHTLVMQNDRQSWGTIKDCAYEIKVTAIVSVLVTLAVLLPFMLFPEEVKNLGQDIQRALVVVKNYFYFMDSCVS